MPVQVWGLGTSGLAAARLLHHQGEIVRVIDEQHNPLLGDRQQQLAALGIQVSLGCPFAEALNCDLEEAPRQIIVSPGIRWQHPALEQARAQGIEVIGEAELVWRSLPPLPWIAITGTNGKTTTTALITALLEATGQQAPACGNIGRPLADVALTALTSGQLPDWIVAELSSYQIEAAPTLAPKIAIWTTFTPDHLERHGTLAAYAAIKDSLLQRASYAILNANDPYLWQTRAAWPHGRWVACGCPDVDPIALFGDRPPRFQAKIWPHQGQPTLWLADQPLLPLSKLRLLGHHNHQNVLLAIAAAQLAGVPQTTMQQVLTTFAGVPHRLEKVATHGPIQMINDSKATNYDAALVGLAAVDPPMILIAGGQPKAGDDRQWFAQILAKVAGVVLVGEAAPQFAARLDSLGYPSYQMAETLDIAVPLAYAWAKRLHESTAQPVTILFSPACASFDQYSNFEQRGDHFRQCSRHLGG